MLLDVESKHYPILSKIKAEILAAFAGYVWWTGVVTAATSNSCRERPHWDMVCGENIMPCCCLESAPCSVSPCAFQQAHWDVTQVEPSCCHQGHEFHGVLHLAESGACISLFFTSAWEKSAQDGIMQFLGFALPSSFGILKSFLQAQGKCLCFSWQHIV